MNTDKLKELLAFLDDMATNEALLGHNFVKAQRIAEVREAMSALLARLEAAEKVVEAAESAAETLERAYRSGLAGAEHSGRRLDAALAAMGGQGETVDEARQDGYELGLMAAPQQPEAGDG